MHDFADLVLDNIVDKGNTVMAAEGIQTRFTPASGITSIALPQPIIITTTEELLVRG